jgi:hypothetical protein
MKSHPPPSALTIRAFDTPRQPKIQILPYLSALSFNTKYGIQKHICTNLCFSLFVAMTAHLKLLHHRKAAIAISCSWDY